MNQLAEQAVIRAYGRLTAKRSRHASFITTKGAQDPQLDEDGDPAYYFYAGGQRYRLVHPHLLRVDLSNIDIAMGRKAAPTLYERYKDVPCEADLVEDYLASEADVTIPNRQFVIKRHIRIKKGQNPTLLDFVHVYPDLPPLTMLQVQRENADVGTPALTLIRLSK